MQKIDKSRKRALCKFNKHGFGPGQEFNDLILKSYPWRYEGEMHPRISAECVCGNRGCLYLSSVIAGSPKKCCCNRKKRTTSRLDLDLRTVDAPQWLKNRWIGMWRRCTLKSDSGYENYGGRGITVCDEWKNFENFRRWAMRAGLTSDLSIDRIDNDGPYAPENCRAATNSEQMRNQRKRRGSTSKYRGVSLRKDSGKWLAVQRCPETAKLIRIGEYEKEKDAAWARDIYVRQQQWDINYGIKLNFPID